MDNVLEPQPAIATVGAEPDGMSDVGVDAVPEAGRPPA